MTKAGVVVFYRYTPRATDHYKTQGELFLKYAKKWFKHLDALYIVDAGWGFDLNDLHPNTTVISEDYRSHWWYMNELLKLVKEDTFMLIDPDIMIYDDTVVSKGFEALKTHDICGILDNSGSLDLFPANEFRDTRRRYTPYLTFAHTKDFKDRDFTPTQKNNQFEFDSMGEITHDLYQTLSLKELPDDRSSTYLNEDFTFTESINLDSPQFEWSKERMNLGYYHIRNSSIGLSLLDEYQEDKPAYETRKRITPFREMMRLLMWQWICDKHTGSLEQYKELFYPVLSDYNVPLEVWSEYESKFENYHSFLKENNV